MGQTILTTFEVTEFEPDRSVTFVSRKSTFHLRIQRSVEPINGGSRIHAVIEGKPKGLLALLGPLLNPIVKKSINRDYTKLKRLLESEIP